MASDFRYEPVKVLTVMLDRLATKELRTFCFILSERGFTDLDYASLEGDEKDMKTLSLVQYAQKRNLVDRLVEELVKFRPDIDQREMERDGPPGTEMKDEQVPLPDFVRWGHWRSWWRWCVWVPTALLCVLWLCEKFDKDVLSAYKLVFEHGEMLVLSALILFGVSVQIKKLQAEDLNVSRTLKWSARSGGVLLLVVFDFVKHCAHGGRCLIELDDRILKMYSGLTLAVTVVSIIFGYYAYWKVKEAVTKA
ncbi:MAG: hypothetical protein JOZ02_11820 [Acidobacteria bacterium]|nr:hypothetical protein [Acidobacteriota bacterium]